MSVTVSRWLALAHSMQRDPIEQVLESALNGFQLRVEIVANLRYCGEWQEREQPSKQGSFHLIGEGECMVESAALAEPTILRSGDLVIFPTVVATSCDR